MKKIAYVTTYDARDIHAWSGSGNRIARALEGAGHPVDFVGELSRKSLVVDIRRLWHRVFSSKAFLSERDQISLSLYAKQAEGKLSKHDFDVIVSPGTFAIAKLKTSKPIVVWTDATFAGMVDYYPSFKNLSKRSIRDGHIMEQQALTNATAVIYASEWAASSAINSYDVDPNKVSVVNFGANVGADHSVKNAVMPTNAKNFESCKLLFIGVDWDRKGGDLALEVAVYLNSTGISTELHVVGCEPPENSPSFVIRHGFLSKKNPEDLSSLQRLFLESHFLIVPSKVECFGVVFAEASSSGLPSIGSDEGGISDAIRPGINGEMFSKTEDPAVIGDYIRALLDRPDDYKKLAKSAFSEYKQRLNWESAGGKVSQIIEDIHLHHGR